MFARELDPRRNPTRFLILYLAGYARIAARKNPHDLGRANPSYNLICSFDDFVGSQHDRGGYCEPQRLRGLQIDENVVGCSTGNSEGLAPLSILPA
jgi:hypothetical protein